MNASSHEDRPRETLSGPVSSRDDAQPSVPAPPPGWSELTSEAGLQVLKRIAEASDPAKTGLPKVTQTLRAEGVDPGLLAAALTLTELRGKATPKFGAHSGSMLLTQAGLEQASRYTIADSHAARFADSGCKVVADLGCGLGAESLAFLRAGLNVRAVEIDPLTADFARHNLALEAPTERFEVLTGDAATVGKGSADAVFLDPARRTAGHRDTKRLNSANDYSPSLDFAFDAAREAKAGGVKLGPGFERELIPEDAEAQWVSDGGQLVEMGLWFGAAARPGVKRAATIFKDAKIYELLAARDADDAEVRELGEYIIEPDGAVIRARLIGLLAAELDAGMIHPAIAYLTSDRLPASPFAQGFRILEEVSPREKDLKRELAKRGIGTLEIKKRGVDVDPAALRTRLRLKGDKRATLILSRSADRHIAVLAERC